MRWMLCLAGLVGALSSCVEPPHYWVEMMGMERGRRLYHISCDEDASNCWRGARAACHGDYVAKEREAVVEVNRFTRDYSGDYLVRCVKSQ